MRMIVCHFHTHIMPPPRPPLSLFMLSVCSVCVWEVTLLSQVIENLQRNVPLTPLLTLHGFISLEFEWWLLSSHGDSTSHGRTSAGKFECFFFFFWPQMLKTVEWRSKTRSFGDHRKKKEKKKSLCNVGKNVISLSKRTPNFISVYVLCPCSCAVSMCFCVLECYAVLHLPVVEMEGDMAGCSLSEEGEC